MNRICGINWKAQVEPGDVGEAINGEFTSRAQNYAVHPVTVNVSVITQQVPKQTK